MMKTRHPLAILALSYLSLYWVMWIGSVRLGKILLNFNFLLLLTSNTTETELQAEGFRTKAHF